MNYKTSIEDLPYVCKRKCYPKLKKIEKMMSNLKSLEEELRAEMSKNAMVRIKRGLSRDQTQEGSLEATPVKKALIYFLQIHLKIKHGFLLQ